MDLGLIQNLASSPISEGRPAGEDVQYDEDFLALVEELDKAEGIDVQPVDWSNVCALGLRILQEQSKDLRVAAYLSVALYHEADFSGLAAGFGLLRELVQADYWDTLYPQRAKRQNKARAAAFDWVIKKLERPLSEVDIQKRETGAVIATAKAFTALDGALAERLGDDAPANLFELRNTLNRFKQEAEHLRDASEKASQQAAQKARVEKVAAEKAAAENKPVDQAPALTAAPQSTEVSAAKPPTASLPAAAPQSVASVADIDRVLTANHKSVEKICELLRQQQLTDPRPYYLLRTSKWMILDKLPPSGVIPAIPAEERLKYLAAQEQAQQYEVLIRECEKSFAGGAIFHLGLHRMVANALQALGAPDASKMVKISVAQLLERFPGYTEQTFANQEPFADALTRAWIDTEVLPGQAAEPSEALASGAREPWVEAAKEAKKRVATGKFEEGVELFRNGVQGAVNERESCFWLLEQARFCYEAGHLEIALPQLTHLHEQMQQRQLQRWEPELNLAIIKLLLICHGKKQAKQKYSPDLQQQVDRLRSQLCLMDPLGALSL